MKNNLFEYKLLNFIASFSDRTLVLPNMEITMHWGWGRMIKFLKRNSQEHTLMSLKIAPLEEECMSFKFKVP